MIHHGDCRDILPTLPDNSVDSAVTDPPYELGFMGKKWDASGVAYDPAVWAEVLRVLRPGGWLLAFGGTRTYHRLACAVEDAGFQVRDSIAAWLYGSGFPKGKGQLKPAWEPIIVARRPAPAPVLQIDACRVAAPEAPDEPRRAVNARARYVGVLNGGVVSAPEPRSTSTTSAGRWPPNVVFAHHPDCADPEPCHPDCWIAELDQQSGWQKDRSCPADAASIYGSALERRSDVKAGFGGEDGASRFFPRFRYQAKASTRERNAGLDDIEPRSKQRIWAQSSPSPDDYGSQVSKPQHRNLHPTVKPLDLMRWLVRLATPPGGAVLDPFAGSGTTLMAATLEGFDSVGIEADADYLPILHARVRWAETQQAALPLEAS